MDGIIIVDLANASACKIAMREDELHEQELNPDANRGVIEQLHINKYATIGNNIGMHTSIDL